MVKETKEGLGCSDKKRPVLNLTEEMIGNRAERRKWTNATNPRKWDKSWSGQVNNGIKSEATTIISEISWPNHRMAP